MRDLFYERFGDTSRMGEIYFAKVLQMKKNICHNHLPVPYDTQHSSGRVSDSSAVLTKHISGDWHCLRELLYPSTRNID
jgi:hypothetical protein